MNSLGVWTLIDLYEYIDERESLDMSRFVKYLRGQLAESRSTRKEVRMQISRAGSKGRE